LRLAGLMLALGIFAALLFLALVNRRRS